jgi:Asp-tRNA(Asn)/Glu-tRNA(Gln) amidotransferase A subunit family amidase
MILETGLHFGRDVHLIDSEAQDVCIELSTLLEAFVEGVPSQPASKVTAQKVPIALKDMIDVCDHVTSLGLKRGPRAASRATALVVDQLERGGMSPVAFTKMPSGSNREQGRPKNPWSFQHICGGSSSGSAVAVAAGCVPLALGSDTAGSLRIPAHCCGVTAWKPTFGAVPVDGTMPLAPSLDTIGFLAREASMLSRVASLFLAKTATNTVSRIAVADDLAGQCDPDIAAAFKNFQNLLSGLGVRILPVALASVLREVDPAVMTVLDAEAGRSNVDLVARGSVNGLLAERLVKGLAITDAQLRDALKSLLAAATIRVPQIFNDADVLVLPVMPCRTPAIVQCEPGSPEFSGRTLYALSRFTRFVNAFGLPAVAVPTGFDGRGLPIGMQLVGRPGQDATLLALAERIQAASDWHNRVPTYVSAYWSKKP